MSMLVMLATLSSYFIKIQPNIAVLSLMPCDVTQQSSYIDVCLLESAAAKLVRHRLHKFAVRTRQTASGVDVRLALLGQCLTDGQYQKCCLQQNVCRRRSRIRPFADPTSLGRLIKQRPDFKGDM